MSSTFYLKDLCHDFELFTFFFFIGSLGIASLLLLAACCTDWFLPNQERINRAQRFIKDVKRKREREKIEKRRVRELQNTRRADAGSAGAPEASSQTAPERSGDARVLGVNNEVALV